MPTADAPQVLDERALEAAFDAYVRAHPAQQARTTVAAVILAYLATLQPDSLSRYDPAAELRAVTEEARRQREEAGRAIKAGLALAEERDALRQLLTGLYVAVLGHVMESADVPPGAWNAMMTTVLDAAEGRAFKPLDLPWPPLPDAEKGE